jgi:hypothetical protein
LTWMPSLRFFFDYLLHIIYLLKKIQRSPFSPVGHLSFYDFFFIFEGFRWLLLFTFLTMIRFQMKKKPRRALLIRIEFKYIEGKRPYWLVCYVYIYMRVVSPIYLFICVSIYLFIYVSVYLCIYMPM